MKNGNSIAMIIGMAIAATVLSRLNAKQEKELEEQKKQVIETTKKSLHKAKINEKDGILTSDLYIK